MVLCFRENCVVNSHIHANAFWKQCTWFIKNENIDVKLDRHFYYQYFIAKIGADHNLMSNDFQKNISVSEESRPKITPEIQTCNKKCLNPFKINNLVTSFSLSICFSLNIFDPV